MTQRGEELLKEYRNGIETLTEHLPEATKEYNHFTGSFFEDGKLKKGTKHLMALAISVKEGDEASIAYHMDQCVEAECTDKEIYESMGVSAAYGGGSAMSQAVTTGLTILQEFRNR